MGLGLAPGDRVGVWATNCAEWILLQFAASRTGLVLVNVNPAYRSTELSYVLRKSRMRALFLLERDQRSEYAQILDQARKEQDIALEHAIYIGSDFWREFLAGGRDVPDIAVRNTDPVNIQYTSGTTAHPRAYCSAIATSSTTAGIAGR